MIKETQVGGRWNTHGHIIHICTRRLRRDSYRNM